MALTTIGLNNLKFGTTQESSSVVRSYEQTITCDPVELLDGDGTFEAVAFANPRTTVNLTLVSGSVSAAVGTLTALDGNDPYRDWETDRKSTRLNSSHSRAARMPSSA